VETVLVFFFFSFRGSPSHYDAPVIHEEVLLCLPPPLPIRIFWIKHLAKKKKTPHLVRCFLGLPPPSSNSDASFSSTSTLPAPMYFEAAFAKEIPATNLPFFFLPLLRCVYHVVAFEGCLAGSFPIIPLLTPMRRNDICRVLELFAVVELLTIFRGITLFLRLLPTALAGPGRPLSLL